MPNHTEPTAMKISSHVPAQAGPCPAAVLIINNFGLYTVSRALASPEPAIHHHNPLHTTTTAPNTILQTLHCEAKGVLARTNLFASSRYPVEQKEGAGQLLPRNACRSQEGSGEMVCWAWHPSARLLTDATKATPTLSSTVAGPLK